MNKIYQSLVSVNTKFIKTGVKMNLPDINFRFNEILKSFELSQNAFGVMLGISQKQVSAIVNGHSRITKMLIELLRCKFGVNPEWLIDGQGRMFLYKPSLQNPCPIIETLPDKNTLPLDLRSLQLTDDSIYLPGIIGSQLFCVRVPDDSMSPHIKTDDFLIIDAELSFKQGVAVIGKKDNFKIRHIKETGNDSYLVWSKKPDNEPEEITVSDIDVYVPIMLISHQKL